MQRWFKSVLSVMMRLGKNTPVALVSPAVVTLQDKRTATLPDTITLGKGEQREEIAFHKLPGKFTISESTRETYRYIGV